MKELNQDMWLGVEHLNNEEGLAEVAGQEFVELPVLSEEKALDTSSNRRDFLKYLGFSLGAATMAASCDIPVRRALPYVSKPDTIVPGVASYYASSFVKGGDYCSVLVKTREGRPIKIEGNSLSKVSQGGTNARAQASVLDLYDISRVTKPHAIKDGALADALTWAEADAEVKKALSGGRVYLVSNTILSPTAKAAIEEFMAKYNAQYVVYDPISSSAILEANQQDFAQKAIPDYHFDKADVIVSVGADFLGTWISPVEYAADYVKNRKIKDIAHPKMSRHIQVESFMSMTGSNADERIMIKPSEQGAAIANLYNEVAALTGGTRVSAPSLEDKAMAAIKSAAKELAASRGKSLVVSGSNNVGEQTLVNAINSLLGNYGQTLDFNHASLQRQGTDASIQDFIKSASSASAVIFLDDANPAFDLPNAEAFKSALANVSMKISCAGTLNDTAALCDYILPTNHFLESWGDAEPKRGMFSLIQPTISPLFDTRQMEESLLTWADSANLNKAADQPYYEYLKQSWQTRVFPNQSKFQRFQAFWDNAVHDGVVDTPVASVATAFSGNVNAAANKINKPLGEGLEIALFEDIAIGGGQYANNPWLQELPEPVTRCTWGNYLQVPVEWNGKRNFEAFDHINDEELYGIADNVKISANGADAVCTAIKSFGVKSNTMAISLGYGRQVISKSGEGIGSNVNPWVGMDANGNFQYYTAAEYGGKASKEERLASVQYHNTIGLSGEDDGETINLDEKAATTIRKGFQGSLTDRVVIRRTNLKELNKFLYGASGKAPHHNDHGDGHGDDHAHEEEHHAHGSARPFESDYMGLLQERAHHQKLNDYGLYPDYQTTVFGQGHHWGLHVDLNACIGCAACAVACTAENNIPVVGKKEVGRHHEMAWMRIDRYYYGDAENPNVVYQPMMCQHCDNAPCENVCPVAATPHNEEGLNQMAYNRCIGTRYCANNCPYKVRRFNWLDYTTADLWPGNEPKVNGEEIPYGADNLTRMVLNPDVTVRSRGVIEKCSFCVQRIQAGKLTAKREGRRLQDADVRTACQTACPTGAITFGDRNNKEGELYKKFHSDLNYIALEQTNVRSSVQYAIRVVNKPDAEEIYTGGHGHSHGADDHSHDGGEDHSH